MQYLMLRSVFTPTGITQDQVQYHVELLRKVRRTSEWQQSMREGAFNQTFMTGDQYTSWVKAEETRHRQPMEDAGLLAAK